MKRTLVILLALIMSLSLFSGIASAEAKDYSGVTIRLANHLIPGTNDEGDHDYAAFMKVAEDMGFKLEIEGVAGDDLRDKISVDAASNNLPDIFKYWPGGTIADMAKAGMLLDVQEYIDASEKFDPSGYPESSWLSLSFDGVKYGIPYQQGIGCLLANKAIFEECGVELPLDGWTLDEFYAACEKFREKGYYPTNVGSNGGNPSHFFYGEYVCQYADGNELSANLATHLQFNNETFTKAAKVMCDMRDHGVFPDDTMAAGDWTPSVVLYIEGKCAMCYTFGWTFQEFQDFPEMVENSVCIYQPALPDGDISPTTFTQGVANDCYCINAKSWEDPLKRDCMIALLDAFFTEMELNAAKEGWRVPVDQNILTQVDYAADPSLMGKVMSWRSENSISGSAMIWSNCPDSSVQYDYQAYMDEMWAGSMDAETYMEKVQESFDEYADNL